MFSESCLHILYRPSSTSVVCLSPRCWSAQRSPSHPSSSRSGRRTRAGESLKREAKQGKHADMGYWFWYQDVLLVSEPQSAVSIVAPHVDDAGKSQGRGMTPIRTSTYPRESIAMLCCGPDATSAMILSSRFFTRAKRVSVTYDDVEERGRRNWADERYRKRSCCLW